MTEVSTMIEERISGAAELTALALQLHEFQYNGPDPEGVRSRIPNEDTAKDLIKVLLEKTRGMIRSLEK
jgi:hypothetical protein